MNGKINSSSLMRTKGPIIRFDLIRVLPSYLEVVTQQIIEVLERHRTEKSIPSYRLFLCFGDYDILLVTKATDELQSVLGGNWIKGITVVREIPAHLIAPGDVRIIDELLHSQMISITFVQLHPGIYQDHGLRIERIIAHGISNEIEKRVALAVYGIPELAIAQCWSTPPDIPLCADNVTALCAETARSLGIRYPILTRTLTFVGVKYPLPSRPRTVHATCQATIELNVTTTPGWVAQVGLAAKEIFGNEADRVEWTAGTFDLALSLPIRSTADIWTAARRIVRFREDNAASVLSTSSTLKFPANDRFKIKDQPLVLQMPIRQLTDKESALLTHNFGDLGRRLLKTAFNFNDIAMNPAMAPSILDLCCAVGSLIEDSLDIARLIESGRADARRAREEIGLRLMPLRAAVDQRTTAAQITVSPIEPHSRYLIGGTSRLLLAVESLPYSIFWRNHRNYWLGYAVAGVRHTDFYHESQVIDVPTESLWHPEDWFPVVHETMHAIMDSKSEGEFNDRDGRFADALQHCTNHNIPEASLEDWNMTLRECVTDILTANWGPVWNPALYFRSVWGYLRRDDRRLGRRDSDELVIRWFIRNTAVWLALHLGPKTRLPKSNEVDKCVLQMAERYCKWGLDDIVNIVYDSGLLRSDVLTKFRGLIPLVEFARRQWHFGAAALRKRQTYFEREANKIIEAAANNKWRFGKGIECPELLVWKLRERFLKGGDANACVRQRAAVILLLADSYWHYRRKAFGRAVLVP